jgi:hypothetical protein
VVCANFAHNIQHGVIKDKTQSKKTKFYNLNVIISVGYRVKSIRSTQFSQWAIKRLKDYLFKGYSVNQKRLEQTKQEVQILCSGIRILGRVIEEKTHEANLDWINDFASGLMLLDDFDHENLDVEGKIKKETIYPTIEEYQLLINEMKTNFDSSVFAIE